jgi:tight adherence protein B
VTSSVALFFLATFLAVAGCMALFRLFGGVAANPANNRVTSEPGATDASPATPSFFETFDSELLKDDSLSTISFWARLLQRFDWVEIMKRDLDAAGVGWSVGRLTMFMLVAGTATLGTLRILAGPPEWMRLVLACGAAAAPYMVILRRKARRLRHMEQQLPDALDTLARALRAGHPVQNALELVAREADAPLAVELRKLAEARMYGMPLDEALDGFAARIPVSEASEFAAAIGIQSRTGGKLHEVLARLSENMRESEALRLEIESISAHGKMTGAILTLMPIGIAIVLTYTNPSQMAVLWIDELGRTLIAAAVVCLIAAHFVIRRLVDIRI